MLDSLSAGSLYGISQRELPANLQAEQSLLGSLLANNNAYERVAGFLRPEHFADRVHGIVYKAIQDHIDRGKLADGVTLKSYFENSGKLDEVGGSPYLATLLSAMVGIINVGEYGQTVYDAWVRRQLISLCEQVANDAYEDSDVGGPQQVDRAEQKLFALASGGAAASSGPIRITDAARAAREEGEAVRRGETSVAAMGKTTLSRCISVNVSCGTGVDENGNDYDNQEAGLPVLYLSNEETATDFTAACLASLAGLSIGQVLGGELMPEQASRLVRAEKRLAETPLDIFDKARQGLRTIAMEARRAARKYKKLGLIVVDYLQIMPDPPGINDKRLAVGQNAYGLKDLAKELGVPIIALSQLSRAVEATPDKRPNMGHLRESGEIEDAADAIILLYREAY